MINVSNYKVVYGDKVLNALQIHAIDIEKVSDKQTIVKPKFLEVVAINEDGNIILIHDEAWMFQFIPKVTKGCE